MYADQGAYSTAYGGSSQFKHGVLVPIELLVSERRKYHLHEAQVCNSLSCRRYACYTLHHVFHSAAHNSLCVPTDTSPQPVQPHAWFLFPLHMLRTSAKGRNSCLCVHCLSTLQLPNWKALEYVSLLDITE